MWKLKKEHKDAKISLPAKRGEFDKSNLTHDTIVMLNKKFPQFSFLFENVEEGGEDSEAEKAALAAKKAEEKAAKESEKAAAKAAKESKKNEASDEVK